MYVWNAFKTAVFTYSACGPFTKNLEGTKKKKKKIKK